MAHRGFPIPMFPDPSNANKPSDVDLVNEIRKGREGNDWLYQLAQPVLIILVIALVVETIKLFSR